MFHRIYSRALTAFIIAVIIVSYTEEFQIKLFMPLRNLIYVPQKNINGTELKKTSSDIPLKASKEGYYSNPWQIASTIQPITDAVLNRGYCNEDEKIILIRFADFFAQNAVLKSAGSLNFAVWPYPISFSYGLRPGWISGMAQGRIALIFAAAAKCADDKNRLKYENLVLLALNSFKIEVENGGVLAHVEGGDWYEEYAQAGIHPPLVLNGHIYALLSLHHLTKVNNEADELFKSGMNGLAHNLKHYNIKTWSYYDRAGDPANNYYQQLHKKLLHELYQLTKNDIFLQYSKLFHYQCLSPFSSFQRFILSPSRFLGFLIIFNCALIFILLIVIDYVRKRSAS